jgi:hypothetical protein
VWGQLRLNSFWNIKIGASGYSYDGERILGALDGVMPDASRWVLKRINLKLTMALLNLKQILSFYFTNKWRVTKALFLSAEKDFLY